MLRGGRYRAATQVKGLSPEIVIVSEAYTVHGGAGRSLTIDTGEVVRTRLGLRLVLMQSESEAKAFGEKIRQRLGKFGLKIAENKSKITEFGRYVWQKAQREGKKVATFDFLGFTHYCDKTRYGKFKSGRKTAKLKFRQKMKAMNEWIKEVRNLAKLKEWWKVLRLKLLGHYRYYGMSGNMQELRKFRIQTSKLAYKWINRRSQKKSYTYKQYCNFKKYNPLPEPKIYHSTYTLSSVR